VSQAFSRRAGRLGRSLSLAAVEPLEARQMLSADALAATTTTLIGPTDLVFTNPAPLTLTAKVEAPAGSPTPTGSVAFVDPDVDAYALPYYDEYWGREYGPRIALYGELSAAYPNDTLAGVPGIAGGTHMLLLGVASLDASGVATVLLPGLSVGAHSIYAVYLGDQPAANAIPNNGTVNLASNPQNQAFSPSTSAPQSYQVTATTTVVADVVGSQTLTNPPSIRAVIGWPDTSPIGLVPIVDRRGTINSATAGLEVWYNSVWGVTDHNSQIDVVGPTPLKGTPGGSTNFYEGTRLLDTEYAGYAVFTPAPNSLKLGLHHIRVEYSGDGGYLPSAAFCDIRITHTPTCVGLYNSITTFNGGGLLSFNATVSTTVPDTVTPSGNVLFLIDGNDVADVRLGSTKKLTLHLNLGKHKATAIYAGDKNCLASRYSTVVTIPRPKQAGSSASLTQSTPWWSFMVQRH
jgi:hypothetical protein